MVTIIISHVIRTDSVFKRFRREYLAARQIHWSKIKARNGPVIQRGFCKRWQMSKCLKDRVDNCSSYCFDYLMVRGI